MTDIGLYEYIAEQTHQGVAAEVLRQSLMESGWTELDIDNAFHDVAAGLSPLTEGVSLHEDVSQVRSMVTLLAARIKNVEAALANVGALSMQGELPPGSGMPERSLIAGRPGNVRYVVLGVGFAVVTGWLAMQAYLGGWYGPLAMAGIVTAIGLFGLAMGYVLLRTGRAWGAAIFTATALAAWSSAAWLAWYKYHAMEWTTALALGVLLLVLTVVTGRRIGRLR